MGRDVKHIGETKTMNCGEVITIIGASNRKGYYKMRTSDGFEFEGYYQSFRKGTIDPNQYINHIGETKTMNCGISVTIIGKADKRNYYKMRTSDGFEFEGDYKGFKRGTINPDFYKDHTGEIKTMNSGLTVTIIKKADKNGYWEMQDSDGNKFTGSYASFVKGTISGITRIGSKNEIINQTFKMNCGLWATCVDYQTVRNIVLKFEDGYVRSKVSKDDFKRKRPCHPDLDIRNKTRNFHGYKITGKRVNLNGDVYYNAIRLSDGEKVYMTPQMMMAAEKTANEV